MGPLAITLVMAVAFTAFTWLAWRKLSIVGALQPEVRWDRPAARLRRVLGLGLLQTRMIRLEPVAGLMHTAIFAGFLALLVRKLQLIAIGYVPGFTFPGTLGGLYAAFKDLVEIAVTLAVLYGFWRRFVLKPRRPGSPPLRREMPRPAFGADQLRTPAALTAAPCVAMLAAMPSSRRAARRAPKHD